MHGPALPPGFDDLMLLAVLSVHVDSSQVSGELPILCVAIIDSRQPLMCSLPNRRFFTLRATARTVFKKGHIRWRPCGQVDAYESLKKWSYATKGRDRAPP